MGPGAPGILGWLPASGLPSGSPWAPVVTFVCQQSGLHPTRTLVAPLWLHLGMASSEPVTVEEGEALTLVGQAGLTAAPSRFLPEVIRRCRYWGL